MTQQGFRAGAVAGDAPNIPDRASVHSGQDRQDLVDLIKANPGKIQLRIRRPPARADLSASCFGSRSASIWAMCRSRPGRH